MTSTHRERLDAFSKIFTLLSYRSAGKQRSKAANCAVSQAGRSTRRNL